MAITTIKRSCECKLYYASDGVAGATWVEVPGVKNVTLNSTMDEDDVTIRQMAGAKVMEPTLVGWSVDFEMPFDESDTVREVFQTAYHARARLGIAVMSSGILVTGSEGLKADMKVFNFTRDEQIDKTVVMKISLKPCLSATAPTYATI